MFVGRKLLQLQGAIFTCEDLIDLRKMVSAAISTCETAKEQAPTRKQYDSATVISGLLTSVEDVLYDDETPNDPETVINARAYCMMVAAFEPVVFKRELEIRGYKLPALGSTLVSKD